MKTIEQLESEFESAKENYHELIEQQNQLIGSFLKNGDSYGEIKNYPIVQESFEATEKAEKDLEFIDQILSKKLGY